LSPQVSRLKDFIRADRERLNQWLKEEEAKATAHESKATDCVVRFSDAQQAEVDRDWGVDQARVRVFEEGEWARVNEVEARALEANLCAEAVIKVQAASNVSGRALKRALEDARLRAEEEGERFRARHIARQEEAYSHLWLRGRKALLEEAARRECRRTLKKHGAEQVELDFAHEQVVKVNKGVYAREWEALVKEEEKEAVRVKKEARVQDALARASAKYVMHMLLQHSTPQRGKQARDEVRGRVCASVVWTGG
jgi:hypothetical protein